MSIFEHLLVGDWQKVRVFDAVRQVAIELAVYRRASPRMGDHVGETRALALCDCAHALLSCAPGVPDQAYGMLGHNRSGFTHLQRFAIPTCCSHYRINPAMITIGALSKRTGVNIETIRYYERIRLIPPAPRTDSGRRLYGAEDVRRLTFIRHARDLGFDIAAIKTMLSL
ncbi:MAG: MerR family transcriptional regulator, partial [Alphaproteobacteria bacterium]